MPTLPRFALLGPLLLAACEPMAPSGRPLEPVRVAAQPAPVAQAPSADIPPTDTPPTGSPFVEEDLFTDGPDPDAEPTGADLLLKSQLQAPYAPAPAPVPVAPAPVAPTPAPVAPLWDGTGPVEGTGSWGVTLLATLLDVQPPRAVVALPDGTEQVVQPGTFLPQHRLVVLAVGRNAVQLAHIEPMGFKSRVETSTIRSLFSAE